MRGDLFDRVVACEVDDAVQDREAELVQERAGAEDGRAGGRARGVEEQVGEHFAQDVFGEGEKRERGRHGEEGPYRWASEGDGAERVTVCGEAE